MVILPYLFAGLSALATGLVGAVLLKKRKIEAEEDIEERLKSLPVDYREFVMVGPSEYFIYKGLCFVRKSALKSLGIDLEGQRDILKEIVEGEKEQARTLELSNMPDKEDEKDYRLSELKFHCKKCGNWVRPVITLDDRLLCPSCSTEIGRITNDNKLLLRTPQFDN